MKYEDLTKLQRNLAVVGYHQRHPEMSLKEVGREFGISQQRVSQILKRYNSQNPGPHGRRK